MGEEGDRGQERGISQWSEDTLLGGGGLSQMYSNYLDCGDSFISIYEYQKL